MKILYFIETYPTRGKLEFSWIANKVYKLAKDIEEIQKSRQNNNSMKLLVNRHINNSIKSQYNEIREDLLIGLTKKENDFFDNIHSDMWSIIEIELWKNYIMGKADSSLYLVEILKRVWHQWNFDIIVNWGTNESLRVFGTQYQIPVVSMELGCTRAPIYGSIYFDFNGVNGKAYSRYFDLDSYKPELSIDEINTLNPLSLTNYIRDDSKFRNINLKQCENLYTNKKTILIPLQLMDDSNVVLYSEFNSMLSFLKRVIPNLLDNGYNIIVKPHPGALHENARLINKIDHNECKNYIDRSSSCYWLESFSNNDYLVSLLTKVDYILTINSSIGFEALLFNKRVICLGKSPYNINGYLDGYDFIDSDYSYKTVTQEDKNTKIINSLLFSYLHPIDHSFRSDYFISSLFLNLELNSKYNKLINTHSKTRINPKENSIISKRYFQDIIAK